MNLDEAIQKRRSVRAYLPNPVPKKDIEKIIEAGIWAPSAYNAQVLKFFVLSDAEKIARLSQEIIDLRMKTNRKTFNPRPVKDPVFYSAPTVMIICTEKPATDYAEVDSFFFAENVFLKATELGLGTCAIGATKLINSSEELLKDLGIPDNWQVLLGFCLGYPAKEHPAPNRKEAEIIYQD